MNETVITAIIVGIIGALVLGGSLWILISALVPNIWVVKDKFLIKRKEQQLKSVDRLIESKQLESALGLLRRSFHLSQITSGTSPIDQSLSLHLAILSRLISIAEKSGTHLESLPIIEDLFQSRSQLQKLFLEAKKNKAPRAVPQWAATEMSKKAADIADAIRTNRNTINMQLDSIFSEIKAHSESGITYH